MENKTGNLMKFILILTIFVSGCSVSAYRDGDKLTLTGFGVQSASWEKDGEKYSISKNEPFSVPDILPVR